MQLALGIKDNGRVQYTPVCGFSKPLRVAPPLPFTQTPPFWTGDTWNTFGWCKKYQTHAHTHILANFACTKPWVFKVPEGHRPIVPPGRLSEEICLSEGSAEVFQRALRGLSEGFLGSLRGSAGVRGIFRGFSGVVTLCLWPSGSFGWVFCNRPPQLASV